ncbi:hypothetical protein [Thalassobius sp. Cn5-15]|jgi:hypothetical protein|uniref:hypothetical protein n=1 Tax=Thalassobius sp. Cn5-15 TaxID=2917763 RepID=UPI001EF2F38F|nr:hypothetical protein [Thalassobius sp. Cn5-15]MCG7493571.1 hypothetical protein [Thalassobius sp. Cn5-15]
MNRLRILALSAILPLAACMTATETSNPTAVDPLLDKQLVSAEGTIFILNADGTVSGEIKGDPVVGSYTTTATEVCSTYSAPDFLTGREYCSTPVIEAGTVVFNRRDGTKSAVYAIEG